MTAPRLSRRLCGAAAAVAALAVVAVPFALASSQTGGFRDIPKDHWAADSVDKLVQAGILKGYPASPFAPVTASDTKSGYNGNKPVTRYELAVTLYRFVEYVDRASKQPRGKLQIKGEPKSGAQAAQSLVAAGYLSKDTPLTQNGGQAVTAKQLTDALSQVIIKTREDSTPASPDSDHEIDRPTGNAAHGDAKGI